MDIDIDPSDLFDPFIKDNEAVEVELVAGTKYTVVPSKILRVAGVNLASCSNVWAIKTNDGVYKLVVLFNVIGGKIMKEEIPFKGLKSFYRQVELGGVDRGYLTKPGVRINLSDCFGEFSMNYPEIEEMIRNPKKFKSFSVEVFQEKLIDLYN